jgi:hypothetical protein
MPVAVEPVEPELMPAMAQPMAALVYLVLLQEVQHIMQEAVAVPLLLQELAVPVV